MLIRSFGLLAAVSVACAASATPAWADPVVAPEVEVVADAVPVPGEPPPTSSSPPHRPTSRPPMAGT
ncbi:hypothetical protein BN970_06616 [Mycolicibacterium conceptionense]|uniref:Uncharacterized protein n=1 Tax=Mycolicibacterium conceptionense TaxID=451644 RepID=A0A0U1E0V7_9MYCO|nr:hypothetical protein BN970_06616 [Mycolicibacterium conceptionense]